MSRILELARKDLDRYSEGGFSTACSFRTTAGGAATVVNALAMKHHFSYDPDSGSPVNSLNVRVSVSEKVLNDAGFVTRNANNQVNLRGKFIEYTDSAGITRNYKIDQVFPDEALGVLMCTLGFYE